MSIWNQGSGVDLAKLMTIFSVACSCLCWDYCEPRMRRKKRTKHPDFSRVHEIGFKPRRKTSVLGHVGACLALVLITTFAGMLLGGAWPFIIAGLSDRNNVSHRDNLTTDYLLSQTEETIWNRIKYFSVGGAAIGFGLYGYGVLKTYKPEADDDQN